MPNIEATKFYVRYQDGHPASENFDYARRGFDLQGVETVPFTSTEEINTLKDLGPTVGIAGYIGDVLKGLQCLGKPLPEPLDYPPILKPYLGRNIRLGTLGEVVCSEEKVFVKPVQHKAFTGFVWQNDILANRNIIGHSLETPVWVSDPIVLLSEYRSFILRGEILDVHRYKGCWGLAPSRSVLEEAVDEMTPHAPAAYCLDWGIAAWNETILVEMNDGFSFGGYGLHPGYMSQMISARWYELTGGSL